MELAPALADAAVIETWSGLRPDTPDHLPSLGPTDVAGLYMATGHYRNGILLAAITARLLREWIVDGGAKAFGVEAFSPLRFIG
jgi:glycine/D-amino acid oxidase-like deaminating enzyme